MEEGERPQGALLGLQADTDESARLASGADGPAAGAPALDEKKPLCPPPSESVGVRRAREHGRDPFQEDCVLPIATVLRGLQATERSSEARRTPAYLLYVLLFTTTVSLALDVPTVHEIQRGVLQSLAERPLPAVALAPRIVFHNVSSHAEFWTWASSVLYPQVFEQERFNTFSYAANASVDGTAGSGTSGISTENSSWKPFAVAKYNSLVTPVRFRQLRSKRDVCSIPADAHALARPCWAGLGSTQREESMRLSAGSSAIPGGTQYFSEGLSVLMNDLEMGDSHLDAGHVVDLELNSSLAMDKVLGMISDRWSDEWTRTLAVDVNTYNAAYGMASVFRFQIDQTIGGRLEPRVEACTCPLDPYHGSQGELHAIVEGFWIVGYILYVAFTVLDLLKRRKFGYFGAYYLLAEWITLLLHAIVISGKFTWFVEDKDDFRRQHLNEFKDLYTLCEKFQYARTSAAFSAVWLFMHISLRIRNYGRFRLIWQTLVNSLSVVVPIGLSVVVAATPLAFVGHWLFGSRVYTLSTWPRAFGFLFRSTISGLTSDNEHASSATANVLDEMRQVDSFLANVWGVSWVVLSKFILYGMFVACVVNTFRARSNIWNLRGRELKEHGYYGLGIFFFSAILKKFSHPEIREPAEMYAGDMEAWTRHFDLVNRGDLEDLVGEVLRRGKRHLEVTDVMRLFDNIPSKSEVESYRRAADWLRALCEDLRVETQRRVKPSTTTEAQVLLRKLARLEEETMGLTCQLQGLADVPCAEPM